MTKEEFLAKVEADSEWAPGWDTIEAEFERLYPGQEPSHYATNLVARASLGGTEYLDGYSIYDSPKGYKHIVTFGMTELYANEEMLGSEYNNWGYEMTMKLKADSAEDCLWALDMLGNLARYTYTSDRYFEPYQYISGGGNSLHQGEESAITALLTVADTEAMTQESIYGKTEFIQLVGITQQEFEAIREDRENAKILVERMKKDNLDLVTDMSRTHSYL